MSVLEAPLGGDDPVGVAVEAAAAEAGPRHRKGAVLRNVGVVVAGRVASLVLGLASSVLLVRHFGTERLGEYTALYAYVSLFAWLPTLGMEQVLVREAARDRASAARTLGSGMALAAVMSVVSMAVAWTGARVLGYAPDMSGLLLLAAADLLLFAPLRLAAVIFQVDLKQGYTAAIAMARQAVWVALVVILVARGAGLGAVVTARVLCGAGEALATLHFGRRVLGRALGFSRRVAGDLLRHSWPIGVSLLGVAIQQRIDQVLIHLWMGDRELGYYAAAVNLTEVFIIVPAAVMGTLLPMLSAAAGDRARFHALCGRTLRVLGMLAVAVCVTTVFAAEPVIRLLFGAEYAPSAAMLRALVWSLVPTFLGGALTAIFVAGGEQRFIPVGAAVAAAVNVALNALLIPRWGGTGAAWATVATYAIANVFLFAAIRATREPARLAMAGTAVPLLAGVGVAAALWALPLPAVAAAVLAPLAYAGALFVLGVVTRDDLGVLARGVRDALPGR